MKNISKNDVLVAFLISIVIFICAFLGIDEGHHWGDDFAAYMSEGISIADNSFDEQVKLNTILHPSKVLRTSVKDKLVYSWGYPLMLSLVYRLKGYNFADSHLLIFYKLPGVISLAILGAVLYIFYRHRFSCIISIILTILFCCSHSIFTAVNAIQNDIPELACCMGALLLMECFFSVEKIYRKIAYGGILGLFLWLCYAIRLMGLRYILFFVLHNF